jgi:uncharacterized protein YkwD
MRTSRRLFVSVITTVVLVTLFPTPFGTAVTSATETAKKSGGKGNDCWFHKGGERKFFRRINGARGNNSVGSLRLDRHLSKAARRHTTEMVNKDTLYHTPSDKLRNRVTKWTILGENVGVGGSIDSLHQAFMNSPAHKANIIYSPFKHVGVGTNWEDGRLWVTVIFEATTNPGTTLPMPSC